MSGIAIRKCCCGGTIGQTCSGNAKRFVADNSIPFEITYATGTPCYQPYQTVEHFENLTGLVVSPVSTTVPGFSIDIDLAASGFTGACCLADDGHRVKTLQVAVSALFHNGYTQYPSGCHTPGSPYCAIHYRSMTWGVCKQAGQDPHVSIIQDYLDNGGCGTIHIVADSFLLDGACLANYLLGGLACLWVQPLITVRLYP